MIWSRSSRASPVPPLLFFMPKPPKKRIARASTPVTPRRPARRLTRIRHLLICVKSDSRLCTDVGGMPHSGALGGRPSFCVTIILRTECPLWRSHAVRAQTQMAFSGTFSVQQTRDELYEAIMPIRGFLSGQGFEPEVVRQMSLAL